MNPQIRFWAALYELVFHGLLLHAHCQAAAKTDRNVIAILAVTSTASLGIWAVFKSNPQLWACIIVVTQIVSAISRYLPWSSRLKASAACVHDFREVQNWAEARWCEILDGELTDVQINKARVELQTKTAKAMKAHFPLDGLPVNKTLNDFATTQAEQYLATHYGV